MRAAFHRPPLDQQLRQPLVAQLRSQQHACCALVYRGRWLRSSRRITMAISMVLVAAWRQPRAMALRARNGVEDIFEIDRFAKTHGNGNVELASGSPKTRALGRSARVNLPLISKVSATSSLSSVSNVSSTSNSSVIASLSSTRDLLVSSNFSAARNSSTSFMSTASNMSATEPDKKNVVTLEYHEVVFRREKPDYWIVLRILRTLLVCLFFVCMLTVAGDNHFWEDCRDRLRLYFHRRSGSEDTTSEVVSAEKRREAEEAKPKQSERPVLIQVTDEQPTTNTREVVAPKQNNDAVDG
eukprot:TRINITY_DN20930_c0_g1_i1.p1 TRINITY_DN20930_c0_g1~~TRINITY_DN20930_c0_g1_i1.p1  ORF type:complete len:298 (+),score=38.45 TRINITY_DN20930_c0_g1_i1:131-1024(+)